MTASRKDLASFLSAAARAGQGRIAPGVLWEIKLMDVDEATLQSAAMQVHDELLESADEAVNDAYAASFLDLVFGYVAPHNTIFSEFWDIHLLSLFDDYTLLARELCEILSVQADQPRPEDYQASLDSYDWLEQGETDTITESSGEKWRHDVHGEHILFTCTGDTSGEMTGTRVEATLANINHVDGGFFLGYIQTCPEHAAIRPWFEENGFQRMTDLLSLYAKKGWLIQTPGHEYMKAPLVILPARS